MNMSVNTEKENEDELLYCPFWNCINHKKYGYIYHSLQADHINGDLKAMQVIKQKKDTIYYIKVTGQYNHKKDCFYYNVQDLDRSIDLYSEKIEYYFIDARNAKELLKLFDWVNEDEVKKLETYYNFTMKDLYSYIMQKAANDKDFLTWWNDYDFRIGLYVYDKEKGWNNTKTIK